MNGRAHAGLDDFESRRAGLRRCAAGGIDQLPQLRSRFSGVSDELLTKSLDTLKPMFPRDGKVTPVLILTARGAWSEKVAGFDAGADDYLTKPFHTEELLARLRALLRRSAGHATATLECGGLRLDPRAARATVNGEPLRLTSLEYRMLHYMIMHQGRVISRTELVEHLYDQDFDRDSNTIEVFVGRVRKKIGQDRIETVRGLGYRLTPLEGEAE